MKTAVLTTSWDDGHRCDVRLARMLKEHGLKATFYVAPENHEFAKEDLLSLPEIRDLSRDFEIGAHSMTHRRLPTISEQEAAREIIESKAVLEQVIGKEIKSFCYPGGAYTKLHVQLVKDTGYRYARTVARYTFKVEDPYEAGTSLHVYNHRFGFDLWQTARFVKFQPVKVLRCLEWEALAKAMFDRVIKEGGIYHIWGHSWEIDEHSDWEALENVFRYISANPKVSYVTNGELGAYS
jgi:peptidoglycan/xylan/chitin deacetylase (PgdA/CDA1 family)